MWVGYVFGEGSELLGASLGLSKFLVSGGDVAAVCASRKPLGFRGACCCMPGLRAPEELIEGFREWGMLAAGGEDGLREDMLEATCYDDACGLI